MRTSGTGLVGIIQARMGSTRLPGKPLLRLGHQTLLEWVVSSARKVHGVELLALATTTAAIDDELAVFARSRMRLEVLRGHPTDVLQRFASAADTLEAKSIVRITGDDPFKDPVVSSRVARKFLTHRPDYCSNAGASGYPEGMELEVMSREALAIAHEQARLVSDREHVTPYIWRQPDRFQILAVRNSENLARYRFTLDTPADLAFLGELNRVREEMDLEPSLGNLVSLVDEVPYLRSLMPKIDRYYAYRQQVEGERET